MGYGYQNGKIYISFLKFNITSQFTHPLARILSKKGPQVLPVPTAKLKIITLLFGGSITKRTLPASTTFHNQIPQQAIPEPPTDIPHIFPIIFVTAEGGVAFARETGGLAFVVADVDGFYVPERMGDDLKLFYFAAYKVVVPFCCGGCGGWGLAFLYCFGVFLGHVR